VELPKGYLSKMPEDVTLTRDYAEFRATYGQDHGILTSHHELKIKLSEVPEGEKEDYKKFAKRIGDDMGHYVVLTASSGPALPTLRDSVSASLAVALRALPDSSVEEAQKFEKEALADMGPDQAAAVEALKRAVAADPKFTRAWITLGSLNMAMSRTDAGLDAFRKAIDSDPKQPVPYWILATALTSMHRSDDAIQVWQSLLKVDPEDRGAMRNLGELYFQQKRYAEAIPTLETAVRLDPEASGPLSQLGLAYMKSGEVDKGYSTLQQALKLDSSALALNNFAYELADANMKLPEALESAQKAVHVEEEASGKIRLADLTEEELHSTQRIGSFWDTLGWVHFRLGHLDEAEKYLHASWILTQEAVVADHLGQLYEQRQRRQDAIHMYRLALWIAGTVGSDTTRADIQGHLSHLVPGFGRFQIRPLWDLLGFLPG
jgi:tetratricopeptide (TPR) repeat protein